MDHREAVHHGPQGPAAHLLTDCFNSPLQTSSLSKQTRRHDDEYQMKEAEGQKHQRVSHVSSLV